MIEFKLFFALISYYFVMFATPGPNNAMLTASGIKFGFRKTLPHLVGIPFGHVIQITLVCFGLGSLFQRYPLIQFYLKWLCFVYLLYLGWKIIGSFSNNEKEAGRPLKFYEAALFQFVNPKGVFAAITSISIFVELGSNYLFHSLVVIGVSFCVAITSITSWCLLGKFLRRFSENKKFIQMFNYAMSFSLVVCVILIYLKI